MTGFTDPVDAVKAVLGMPRDLDYPELVHPEPRADEPVVYDHKTEAEQAARAGKYEIATFHALMRIGDLLETTPEPTKAIPGMRVVRRGGLIFWEPKEATS